MPWAVRFSLKCLQVKFGAFPVKMLCWRLICRDVPGQHSTFLSAQTSDAKLGTHLAGKNLVRNDGETPEATAAGNIAKAQQSSGNAVDSIKCGNFLLWLSALVCLLTRRQIGACRKISYAAIFE